MTCLAGLLLMAPISVLAEKESPLAGPNVANLTARGDSVCRFTFIIGEENSLTCKTNF
jgi:hypothetical protein